MQVLLLTDVLVEAIFLQGSETFLSSYSLTVRIYLLILTSKHKIPVSLVIRFKFFSVKIIRFSWTEGNLKSSKILKNNLM